MTVRKLTERQLKAVGLLAQGLPASKVARQLGVSVRTVERWSVRSDIRQAVQDAQAKAVEQLSEEVFQKCREALTRGLPKSVTRVLQALDHPDARIQIKAAELVSKWSGFYQQSTPTKPEPPGNAEQNLKGYLAYLETTNGSGNHNH